MSSVIDLTANMTLDEIRDRDDDNFELLYKSCKAYVFPGPDQARACRKDAINKALEKLGVNQAKMIHDLMEKGHKPWTEKGAKHIGAKVQEELDRMDVKPETRDFRMSSTPNRSGHYIYHGNEIAYFISEVMTMPRRKSRDTHIIILDRLKEYIVMTNAPIEDIRVARS